MTSLGQEEFTIVPQIGERKTFTTKSGQSKIQIWFQCPKCKKCRWVEKKHMADKDFTGLCANCVKRRPRPYKPYKHKDGRIPCGKSGYYKIKLQPDDFFYPMSDRDGYVFEHRLVMANVLGRCLHRWELVHHRGIKYPKGSKENRGDNPKENLQLVSDERHQQITILENRIRYLEGLLTKDGIKFNGKNKRR